MEAVDPVRPRALHQVQLETVDFVLFNKLLESYNDPFTGRCQPRELSCHLTATYKQHAYARWRLLINQLITAAPFVQDAASTPRSTPASARTPMPDVAHNDPDRRNSWQLPFSPNARMYTRVCMRVYTVPTHTGLCTCIYAHMYTMATLAVAPASQQITYGLVMQVFG